MGCCLPTVTFSNFYIDFFHDKFLSTDKNLTVVWLENLIKVIVTYRRFTQPITCRSLISHLL